MKVGGPGRRKVMMKMGSADDREREGWIKR